MKKSIICIVLAFCFACCLGFRGNNSVNASYGLCIKSSVSWNNQTYMVYVPTAGVNDSVKKEFDKIQKYIEKVLDSKKSLYKIKGYSTSKNIAYKVGKYYYMCKAVKTNTKN
ncbi:hypothetical protein [Ruminiclostridium papyrosolvens]|uniref:Lipoprotein n=1 Tax=Ruminiclostridium papyrosolvens C7 TaxID=1330534 RepID=U4QXF6_9FIRM|nr:hypothetical protein [Ruminiclostridium papyrosolvens]EPR07492.1 hypothetical protein L323_20350 [Ruminiclostridium papyrosolvens C7]